jgi:RHS repeat-associated protein
VDGGAFTTTRYHIDPNNHTGYAQVLEERNASGQLLMSYTLGHDVISQTPGGSAEYPEDVTAELLADGHGSTRILWNIDGNPFEFYAYDAFGNMLSGPGLTMADDASTRLLYSGEQTDNTGLQYLRARYYDPRSGRFNRLDPFAGNTQDPLSLHKYLYANADPVNAIDPSGLLNSTELLVSSGLGAAIDSFVFTAIIGLEVERRVQEAAANAQLRTIAQLHGTEVVTRVEDLRRRPNSRVFVHGSNAGNQAWYEGNGIQAVGRGDFGTGFYTFAESPQGIAAAVAHAQRRADFTERGGGLGFVLFVAIDANRFAALSTVHLGQPTSPTPSWSPTVNAFRANGDFGFLGVDVAIGPVAKQGYDPLTGTRRWIVNPTFPNQYKFESIVATSQLTPIGIIPVTAFGPQLAYSV